SPSGRETPRELASSASPLCRPVDRRLRSGRGTLGPRSHAGEALGGSPSGGGEPSDEEAASHSGGEAAVRAQGFEAFDRDKAAPFVFDQGCPHRPVAVPA